MSDDNSALWNDFSERVSELEALQGAMAVLGWDQQTMMPKGGAEARGQQAATLSKLYHERLTDPAFGDTISALSAAESDDRTHTAGVRNLRRSRQLAINLPSSFVKERALARAAGDTAWKQARADGAVDCFLPALKTLIDFAKQEAELISSPDTHPYDALLEHYEPGMTVESLKSTFSRLEPELRALLDAVGDRPCSGDYKAHFSHDGQLDLHRTVAKAIGFDLGAGRLDESVHPFTCGTSPGDVRITTRIDENSILSGLGGTVHEIGHGLYEQGLPTSLLGTGACEAASTGLHESQSRFWENFIGGSLPFFEWLTGLLPAHFDGATAQAQVLFQARNRVTPSLIRVEADEVTYNLHILVRFQLEVALLEDQLTVNDLEDAWNETYRRVLGITPTTPNDGVLQDVHWSHGYFGYFPTYTLGNLWAASLAKGIEQDQPDLWNNVRQGRFGAILAWLRENIHAKAHTLDATEIVRQAVGERDSVADLAETLWNRHGALHGLSR